MKNLLYLFLLIATAVIVCNGCKEEKKPIAEFQVSSGRPGDDSIRTGKVFYTGDTVVLTNKSLNAFTYKWILPNGETMASADITVFPNTVGAYTVKLVAFSSEGNFKDTSVKILNIAARTGNVTFWYDTHFTDAIVKIGEQTRTITDFYAAEPECEASGCASFTLPAGTYDFTASSKSLSWSGTVTVSEAKCTTYLLTGNNASLDEQ